MVKRALAVLAFAASIRASELTVDNRTPHFDDEIIITVIVDGSLASIDPPSLPTENLIIDGAPSVSSEFQWINGATSRRKVFRYSAHARTPGPAKAGPLTLRDSNGVQVTLPAVTLDIIRDLISSDSGDPSRIMHELIATGRDPVFIFAQADRTNVFEGEEVVVTWTLYAGATVQNYALGDIPKLQDFWVEELEVRNDQSEPVLLGDIAAQRLTVRRAALFPLRTGALTIGPMTVNATVMKRTPNADPFGLFEGMLSEVHRRSSPIVVDARPVPPGPPVVAVTNIMNLLCSKPEQKGGGPVVFDVTLSGRANLRSAQAPALSSAIDGNLQIVDRGTAMVYPVTRDVWMSRRWRYLIFPERSGSMTVPALAVTFLTPAGDRRESRCEARTLEVAAAAPTAEPGRIARLPARALEAREMITPSVVIIGAAVIVTLMFVPRLRRQSRLRQHVRSLVGATPAETRDAVEAELIRRGIDPFQLIREPSDRGDAFRAFRSLIDATEHGRIEASPRDVANRIRDLLVVLKSRDADDSPAHPAPAHGR